MLNHVSRLHAATLLALIAAFAFSPVASAKCGCPDDGDWIQKSSRGLGESRPDAADLAADPAWEVYKFEGSGIEYFQVNDRSGVVHAATGRIGDLVWAMPLGVDADRVAVPGDALPSGTPRVLYRGRDVEIVLYQDGVKQRWLVRPTVTSTVK